MSLGKKNIYAATDRDGDKYVAELRHPSPDEWVQYKKETTQISTENRKVTVDYDPMAKIKFFDLLVIDCEFIVEDDEGNKQAFNMTDKPLPADTLTKIKKALRLPAEATVVDTIPRQFKMDAVTVLFDAYEEKAADAKKK